MGDNAPRAIDYRASATGGILIALALVIALFWTRLGTRFPPSNFTSAGCMGCGQPDVPSQWFNTIAAVGLAFLEPGCS